MKNRLMVFFMILSVVSLMGCAKEEDIKTFGTQISDDFSSKLNILGRTTYLNDSTPVFSHSASGFEVKFKGTELTCDFTATSATNNIARPYISIFLDGDLNNEVSRIKLDAPTMTIQVLNGLDDKLHTIRVLKSSEQMTNGAGVSEFGVTKLTTDGQFYKPDALRSRKIEFFGDSITCGYGILANNKGEFSTATQDVFKTYAALASNELNAEYNIMAASGYPLLKNPWNENRIPDGFSKMNLASSADWDFTKYMPDVVVINLGTNDLAYLNSLTGQALQTAKSNYLNAYEAFVNKIYEKYPNVHIVCAYGMMAPINAHCNDLSFLTLINGLKDSGKKISALKLAGTSEYPTNITLGHPGLVINQRASATLSSHILQIMSWN